MDTQRIYGVHQLHDLMQCVRRLRRTLIFLYASVSESSLAFQDETPTRSPRLAAYVQGDLMIHFTPILV